MSGMRSKINDRFEFPSEIDMAPYHVDNLKGTAGSSLDMFELVGILVHSGTAESGHYYSYIRERPVTPGFGRSWVEYNDADLTRFDPSSIPDQCFGGMMESPPFTAYYKQWNAYCLFYQRRESINTDIQTYHPPIVGMPVKTEVPAELYNRIAINNQIFARKYCLLDPSHASFANSLLEQLRYHSNGVCSESHRIEKEAIWLALEHLNQVFSRAKDCLGFRDTLASLRSILNGCASCNKIALDWVTFHERNLKTMLLRCPSPKVREDFTTLLLDALKHLRSHDIPEYGFSVDEDSDFDPEPFPFTVSGALPTMVLALKDLTCHIPNNSRGWDDYYGLLAQIAGLGKIEAYLLLREGFLATCLEYSVVEHTEAKNPLRHKNSSYTTYLRLVERGRKYSFKNLIDLLRILLENVNLVTEPLALDDGDDRPLVDHKAVLSTAEDQLLRFGSEAMQTRSLVFLERILTTNHNPVATGAIIRMLVLAEPDTQLFLPIYNTILSGVNVEPATLASPFLEAALVYCEVCHIQSSIKELLKNIALEVDTIGNSGGVEHLEFFSRARRLSNIRIQRYSSFFTRLVLLNVPFWAPALIMFNNERVRNGTIQLLQSLVFDHDTQNMDDEHEAAVIEKVARELCMECVKRLQRTVTEGSKAVDLRSIEQIERIIVHCVNNYCQDEPYRQQAVIAEGMCATGSRSYDHILTAVSAALDNVRAIAVSDVDDTISGE